MNPQPKIDPKRNEDFLRFKRNKPCLVCHNLMAVAHHVRRLMWGAGGGIKPHDYCTLSLCDINECHDPKTEARFDCEQIIIDDMIKYAIEKYGRLDVIDGLIDFIESKRRKK